jgi:putative transposase
MGRSPRIEFQGAIYHVMCRGDRSEAVFLDDKDCGLFIDTLGEVCGRTGWHIHAYVLMGNHYHLLLETPEPNLVDGMRWLQGTYTKRFNGRHKLWGHLFQGRYKALLVEGADEYFGTVSDYIHLNPARAGLFDLQSGKLTDYRWSSFPLYFSPSNRPEWLCVDRSLGRLGLADDREGRSLLQLHLQKKVLEIACGSKPWEVDERWAKIRRGWCFGSEEFREKMSEKVSGVLAGKRRESFSGDEVLRHDTRAAEHLMDEGLCKLDLSRSELDTLPKGDQRKMVVAWMIRKQTSVRNEWISNALRMGSPARLSTYLREVDAATTGELARLREMLKC